MSHSKGTARLDDARVRHLDILRGCALFGMILAHVNDLSVANGLPDSVAKTALTGLVYTKAGAAFAVLLGVSVGLQVDHAATSGRPWRWPMARRLAGFLLIGITTEAMFGFAALVGYALWSLPLLFLATARVRTLVFAAVLSAMSLNLYYVASGSYQWIRHGAAYANTASAQRGATGMDAWGALRNAEHGASYRGLTRARVHHMRWSYTQPFSLLPWNTLAFFLLGLASYRAGIWTEPGRHARLLYASIAVGFAAWAASHLLFPLPWPQLSVRPISWSLQNGFGLIRTQALVLAYVGAGLLVLRSGKLRERLQWLATAGRLSLTNYVLHAALLDVMFRGYGFDVSLPSVFALPVALLIGAALSATSGLWLARFYYGPLEWALRCLTYGQLQPIRRNATQPVAGRIALNR